MHLTERATWEILASENASTGRTDTLLEEFRSTRSLPIMRLKWSPDGRFLGVSYQTPADNLKIDEPKACKEANSPRN